MGKEQYFMIITLVVGIINALPKDNIVFIDSLKTPSISYADQSNLASKLPSEDTCGQRKIPSLRIIGGSDSKLGAWPWMVALGYKNVKNTNSSIEWLCGGTLISNKHVLTASTCVNNTGSKILAVARLGDLDLDPKIDDGATPLDVPIERIIQHKEYNKRTLTDDIALLVLKNNIDFTELIQPICLPLSPDMKNIDMGNNLPFIAGWGTTEFRGKSYSSLKEVRIPVISPAECSTIYRNEKILIDDRVLCAGETGKDSCQGDSGSPLMWFKKKQFYLMGIVSYGKLCGVDPGVYTKITSFTDWILENL